uniref:Uncharacterized protein n=1 Tax=Dunaliella tertiolecta TaxID=3047 RepID=A0A7S3QND3_DUNTE
MEVDKGCVQVLRGLCEQPLMGLCSARHSGPCRVCLSTLAAHGMVCICLLDRMKGSEGERVRGGVLGLGLLVGGATFSYGYSCGCKKAEILAINDDDAWHARLVKYYSYFGFKPVAIVGGNSPLSDIPHMLVWGGVGTRMDADIPGMLAKWTPAFRSKRERLREGEHLAASE